MCSDIEEVLLPPHSLVHIMELSEDNQRNVAIAEGLKEEGTRLFREGNFQGALAKYARIFLFINGLVSSTSDMAKYNRANVMSAETEAKVTELKHSTLMNQAMCLIKMNEPSRAVEKCDKAIELKRTSRALFRRGQALLLGGNLRRAREDFLEGKNLEPGNAAFDEMLAKVDREEGLADRAMAKGLKGMFG